MAHGCGSRRDVVHRGHHPHGHEGLDGPLVATGTETTVGEAGNTEAIGDVLYSTYLFPFEVASLILLVAMIGAIVLAKKTFQQ